MTSTDLDGVGLEQPHQAQSRLAEEETAGGGWKEMGSGGLVSTCS
jgi:hypothetical protein